MRAKLEWNCKIFLGWSRSRVGKFFKGGSGVAKQFDRLHNPYHASNKTKVFSFNGINSFLLSHVVFSETKNCYLRPLMAVFFAVKITAYIKYFSQYF